MSFYIQENVLLLPNNCIVCGRYFIYMAIQIFSLFFTRRNSMFVSDIMTDQVISIDEDEPVTAAARLMKQHNFG